MAPRPTSATIAVVDPEKDELRKEPKPARTDSQDLADLQSLAANAPTGNAAEAVATPYEAPPPATLASRRIHDIFLLIAIVIMLTWPWIFWGVLRHLGGIKMRNRDAKIVQDRPQTSAFFAALIGNFVSLIVDILFSLAVIRFAQEWVHDKDKVSVFHVSLLGAFRHQSFPWTMEDLKALLRKNKWLPVALVGFCILSFQFVPSGATALLIPVPFNITGPLLGSELDFTSTAADCQAWLTANGNFSNDCDWQTHKGVAYTSCLGQNQLLDILAAGRSSLLSLEPNNTESLALNQLGAKNGMHILGPLRGILPLGPDGVPAFDTLGPSAFTNNDTREGMLAYNYTLQYQGLSANITCGFDSVSPIVFSGFPAGEATPVAVIYNGDCPAGNNFLANADVVDVMVPRSFNNLHFWACRAPPSSGGLPSYLLYLQGRGGYGESFGNITCQISPVQLATYPVSYQSETRLFRSGERTSPAPSFHLDLIERALIGMSSVFKEAQNSQANLVMEAVITAGVKNFDLSAHDRDDGYLPLVGQMISGMLEYQAAYVRLIYSTVDDPPASCLRNVPGEVSYTVFGWHATLEQVGFLIPMTFLILAALGIILAAMIMSKADILDLADPTHPLRMMQTATEDKGDRNWGHSVSFRRSTMLGDAFDRHGLPAPSLGALSENIPVSL